MKINKLIKELEQVKKEHGNLDVDSHRKGDITFLHIVPYGEPEKLLI